MTKPIQRHRLKSGPKPKVDMAVALPVLAESKSINKAAQSLGVHRKTLEKAVVNITMCLRCDLKPRYKARLICSDCVALEMRTRRADFRAKNPAKKAGRPTKAKGSNLCVIKHEAAKLEPFHELSKSAFNSAIPC